MKLTRREESPLRTFRTPRPLVFDTWSPMTGFEEISQRMKQLFNRPTPSGEKGSTMSTDWNPSVNMSETKRAYTVQAELAEVSKEDLAVSLDDGLLTIEGKREHRHEEEDATYHRVECSYGLFIRRFAMPQDADEANIRATFNNGMLTVTVPRSNGKPKHAKRIEIT